MPPSKELFKWDSGHKPPWGEVIGMYQTLHALRGFWPMAFDENLRIIDYSGQGRTLSRQSYVTVNCTVPNIVPYFVFGADKYLYRATEAGLELTGAAGMVGVSGQQGITIGTWVRPGELPGLSVKGLISKYGISGNRSYRLYTGGTNQFRFLVSGDGTTLTYSELSSAFETSKYYFVVGRWIPSVSIDLFVNGEKVSNTTSIPASVNACSYDFQIGAYGSVGTWSHSQRFPFVCAAGLSDEVIQALYHNTRALFGV